MSQLYDSTAGEAGLPDHPRPASRAVTRRRGLAGASALRLLVRPEGAVTTSVLLSAGFFALPVARLPDAVSTSLTPSGLALLLIWYGTITAGAAFGGAIGRRLPRHEALAREDLALPSYVMLSLTGLAGVAAVVIAIGGGDLIGTLADSVANSRANELKRRLYEDYSAGFYTLRYATVLSGAIAIYRLLFTGADPAFDCRARFPMRLLDLGNLGLLGFTALISSRLAVVCCVLIVAHLAAARGVAPSVSRRGVVLTAVGVVAALTFYNHSRNANYYREHYDASSPAYMQLVESKRYLGEPFRVSLAVADAVMTGRERGGGAADLSHLLVPTFLRDDRSPAPRARPYDRYVDVDPGLTTNSAAAELLPLAGAASLPFIALVGAAAGGWVRWMERQGPVAALSAGAILYAFAEFWRTFLFNSGVVIFLAAAPVAVAAVSAVLRAPRRCPAREYGGVRGAA